MTREEKIGAIRKECEGKACTQCPLNSYLDCGFYDYDDHEIDKAYDLMFPTTIKDSGERREFDTGAVRDIQEGKGRCDLMPLDVVGDVLCGDDSSIIHSIGEFQHTNDVEHLFNAVMLFSRHRWDGIATTLLEVAKHFEEGAKKYGEHNWQKGIPVHCYIDSAVRHYLKWLRGDTDEPHDRAFVWNILCCIWTCNHKPELNDLPFVQNDERDE